MASIPFGYGLSLGYMLTNLEKKEKEIRQGENGYLASCYQIPRLAHVSSLTSVILSQMPNGMVRTASVISNALMPAAGIILFPTFALVKQGHYEQAVACVNTIAESRYPRLAGLLPQQLSDKTVKWFSFLAEKATPITNVAVLAGTVALPYLGFSSLAAGIAVPVIFEKLNSANLVPECIGLSAEKYMPTIVNALLLAGGGPLSKIFSAATLASEIPGASAYTQKKIGKLLLKIAQLKGPSLEEIDAPWQERENLCFEEINYILDNDDSNEYEINPAHCSKQATLGINIPENRDFKNFLTLFETIKWNERYFLLKNAFRDDDRFLRQLKQTFPGNSNQDFYDDFEIYVEKLASETNLSKEDFLAKQLHEQMNHLVRTLCHEEETIGSLQDLEEAKDACGQILAYLLNKSMDNHESIMEIEDILLKLAMEAGKYCARGVKRAALEISSSLILQGLQASDDPLKTYELKIRQRLQLLRQRIMQNMYQKLIECMVQLAKGSNEFRYQQRQTTDAQAVAIAQDVHTMDMYRMCLALGFYPLTEDERRQFNFTDLMTWAVYQEIRDSMYSTYQAALDEVIKEEGELVFCNYLRQKISLFKHLSPDQQDALIDKLAGCSEGEKTLKSFHRLLFVKQGVLKVKKSFSDSDSDIDSGWVELPQETKAPTTQIIDKEFSDWEQI